MRNVLARSIVKSSLLVLTLTLAACGGGASSLLDFSGKEAPLSGDREAVLPDAGGDNIGAATEPLVLPQAFANTSWSQPGGNAAHSLQHLAFGPGTDELFSVNAGEGSNKYGRLTAPPIIDGGRAFILDSEANVQAIDAATGKRLWDVSLVPKNEDPEGGYGGGLASDGVKLYAVTAFGEAIAISMVDGKILWRERVDAAVRTAPTVADGRLIFVAVNNDITALSTVDGMRLWTYQGTGEQAAALSSSSPAIAGDIVIAPTTAGDLVAVSASSGMMLWQQSLTALDTSTGLANLNDISARPVISGDKVFAISHTGRFAAFNLNTGERMWELNISGTEAPWIAGDALFLISENNLAAHSTRSGGNYWQAKLPKGKWIGPVLAGGRLLALSDEGNMASFDPQTGKLLATRDLGGSYYIAPVIASGTAYLLNDDADLTALR